MRINKDLTLQEAIELVELLRLEGHDAYFKTRNGKVTVCMDYVIVGNPNFAECLVQSLKRRSR